MRPHKTRAAKFKGQVYPVKWNMPALFLFAEYTGKKTIEDAEQEINMALMEVRQVSGAKEWSEIPITSIKVLAKICRAATGGVIAEEVILAEIGEGNAGELVEMSVAAYLDNLPDYEAGITEDAPKGKEVKKKQHLRRYTKWLRKWVGGRQIFGTPR